MSAQCVRCGSQVDGTAYADVRCGIDRPRAQLAEIADTTPAARDVAHGLSQHANGGAGSGKPGSRMVFDTRATARLDAVQNELVALVRQIAEERGLAVPPVAPKRGPVCRGCLHESCAEVREREPLDVIVAAAQWLPGHLEWLRHRREVAEALPTIAAAARVVTGIVNGPAAQKFLGPCRSTVTWDDDDNEVERDQPCTGDVYGHPDAKHGTCRTCGARWATDKRTAWLDGEVRGYAFRASEIANAYGVNVNSIRTWSTRVRQDTGEPPLASWWRTETGIVTRWVDPVLDPRLEGEAMEKRLGEISDEIQARGGRLHYVGDVLDLAAGDAARREGDRATRARRTAARETAEMGA